MESLPSEILGYILSYLSPRERLSAGLVNSCWLDASATLLEDVCLTFRGRPLVPTTGRIFPRVTLFRVDIDDRCIRFLNHLGPTLLHIRLVQCHVSTRNKAVRCLSLKTLVLKDTNFAALFIFATLPCLRELNLYDAFCPTDKIMAFDEIATPNLKLFAMPKLMIPCTFWNSLITMTTQDTSLSQDPFHIQPSFGALEAFVARRAATLKTLYFPKSMPSDNALSFSRVAGLKLRGVSFARSDIGVAKVFTDFFQNQPGIVALNVDEIVYLNNEHLEKICLLLPELQDLSAHRSFDSISSESLNSGLNHLFRLRHLRRLSLTSCDLSSSAFLRALSESPLQTFELRALDLKKTNAQDDAIRALLSRSPWLKELNLSGCSVSDSTLEYICPLLPRLRSLSLRSCHQLSDAGLRKISTLSRIERLDLCYCLCLTNDGIIESVRSLGYLRKLDLRKCPRVTINIREMLIKHIPFLTLLY